MKINFFPVVPTLIKDMYKVKALHILTTTAYIFFFQMLLIELKNSKSNIQIDLQVFKYNRLLMEI